jgi:hypothetical protein
MAFTRGQQYPLVAPGAPRLPLAWAALRSAAFASAVLATVALGAGLVRLLPWLLDPNVPWRVASPFARGLASIALEALLVGWPVGWALACVRAVESGEARVLQSLGERPARTVVRLLPQVLLFGAAIASCGVVWGRDAGEPGRVATELIAQARVSCGAALRPTRYAVPFTELTWLCAAGAPPRLVGTAPGAISGALFSASDARVAGDFRAIDLDDAHLVLGAGGGDGGGATRGRLVAKVHVGELHVRGLAPWSRAATLPFGLRALLFSSAGAAAAALSAFAALVGALRGRLGAIVIGAAGPLAALGLVRLLERTDAGIALYFMVPLAAVAACAAASFVSHRLPRKDAAATNNNRA